MSLCQSLFAKAVLTGIVLTLCSNASADDPVTLIQQYCVDCHGAPDEAPEGDFSLTADFKLQSLLKTGPTLKKALDAIEGFEMPPADSDQPTSEQRIQMAAVIRKWLAKPTVGDRRDPGSPVLRHLTRLEYNNTIRDLLGLETDVFMFSERLPFDRGHYQPETGKVADQFTMGAREYGAKYPVLLPDASLPSDSRAEYGFTNRADAQNVSAVRLEQYIRLAGEIAFHPELLSRAERMQELFPNAKFRQTSAAATENAKPLGAGTTLLAPNNNVPSTADGSDYDLGQFRERIETAFAEDRAGVFGGEELRNTKIAGKGGLLRITYGKTAQRVVAINPNEDLWFAPFATAEESSGDTLLTNHRKKQTKFELTFQSAGTGRFTGIAELGVVVLSRRGQEGVVRLTVTFDDDTTKHIDIELKPVAGEHNTFASFSAKQDRHIKRLAIDGSKFSGDYVLLDDLALVTRDVPNRQPLVQAEEPATIEPAPQHRSLVKLNRDLAKRSPAERIGHFMRRAFRRNVKSSEVEIYVTLYDAEMIRGGNDETAMRSALHGILASPSFLYLECGDSSRLSLRDNIKEPKDSNAAENPQTVNRLKEKAPTSRSTPKVVPLTDHGLASRLSYFLWSSMPGDELFTLADNGKLQDLDTLETQVRRMQSDQRSIELSENFYVQWLRLQELWSVQPDRRLFSEFYFGPMGKRTLAQDMFGEALLLFQTILIEDRPVTDLLDSDYAFVNGKLIDFYESNTAGLRTFTEKRDLPIDAAKNDHVWHRIQKFDPQRGGIVTSPAVLTLTSFPHRTSSIRRGVWILDTVFNRHPPPPKVAVADIDEQENSEQLTLREKVEMHRANAACAVCHDRIDPPGFALENFDAIGRWRNKDGDEAIDASGVLAGAGAFRDSAEFKALLVAQKRRFVLGLTEHLLSYAIGRQLEYFDVATVEQIVEQTIKDDYRLSRIIVEIVKSDPFRFGVQ